MIGGSEASTPAPLGPVHIIGTGLIGASIGLALRRHGVRVTLADPSPTSLALACDLGAGEPGAVDEEPTIVVVAAPPDVVAAVVVRALADFPASTVTDVASIKDTILTAVRAELGSCGRLSDIARYVGSHPMAGRERSGAIAAQTDLFEGRTWVVTPHEASAPTAIRHVEDLARLAGSVVAILTAEDHDAAVAAVSHLPQVAASLVAARLGPLPTHSVGLAGQGLRDVTRIAASDPVLWTQILAGNAGAVVRQLRDMARQLDDVITALDRLAEDPEQADGARAVLARVVADGNAGRARIPGKHGSSATAYAVVTVVVPDEPGSLARLLDNIGAEGVNLEDLRIEHEIGRMVGIAEVLVLPAAAASLRVALRRRGWTVHDADGTA